ncbi:acyl-CoA dehydrogenase family protein, partial [Neisseria sp. P0014.S004]
APRLHNRPQLLKTKIPPTAHPIDRKGQYPQEFMLEFGKIGGFAATGTVEEGGNCLGLETQIAVLR